MPVYFTNFPLLRARVCILVSGPPVSKGRIDKLRGAALGRLELYRVDDRKARRGERGTVDRGPRETCAKSWRCASLYSTPYSITFLANYLRALIFHAPRRRPKLFYRRHRARGFTFRGRKRRMRTTAAAFCWSRCGARPAGALHVLEN